MEHYDVIIIGTGAGGGTLAYRLAPSGKRILLLERGAFLPREKQNWDVNAVFLDNRYVSQDTWYDHRGKPFQPGSHYFVGGATKLYGAALFRMRKEDFGELKHYDGISPAWPITYEALEPYYTQAEHLYQVRGLRGADPTDPPASAPYLFPPLSHEPRIQELYDDLEKAGYYPSPAPTGILLNEQAPHRSLCIRCDTCDGFPCLVLEAKLHSMLEHLGCHRHLIPNNLYLGKHIPIAGVGHQTGTCRFGTDPATSVLAINCKAHELDNLYVVDTSFFPSIAAVNPSLTAMANALRVGDRLLERLG